MNLIPTIREALGLQENEEFRIKYYKSEIYEDKFRFTNIRLEKLCNDSWFTVDINYLVGLINGQYEVAKLPFKPAEGEIYYYVILYCGDVSRTTYMKNCKSDAIRANSGNCYRTREEAEKHVDEWMEKLYGKDWRELYESNTDD